MKRNLRLSCPIYITVQHIQAIEESSTSREISASASFTRKGAKDLPMKCV